MDSVKWIEIILICFMAVFFGVLFNGDFDKATFTLLLSFWIWLIAVREL